MAVELRLDAIEVIEGVGIVGIGVCTVVELVFALGVGDTLEGCAEAVGRTLLVGKRFDDVRGGERYIGGGTVGSDGEVMAIEGDIDPLSGELEAVL